MNARFGRRSAAGGRVAAFVPFLRRLLFCLLIHNTPMYFRLINHRVSLSLSLARSLSLSRAVSIDPTARPARSTTWETTTIHEPSIHVSRVTDIGPLID